MDTPVSGVSLSERPLLARLLEEESYLAQYHAYIQEIVTGWMSTAEEKIDALDALIGEYVKNDATAFYINEDGQTVVVFPAYTVAPGFMGDVEFVIG